MKITWFGTAAIRLQTENSRVLPMMGSKVRTVLSDYAGVGKIVATHKDNLLQADGIMERLQPKAVLLDHWDNTYPPITTTVNTIPFQEKYSGKLRIIKPEYKAAYTI